MARASRFLGNDQAQAHEIRSELKVHTQIEEEVFDPAAREALLEIEAGRARTGSSMQVTALGE